ncbi:MAG: cytochrome c oxidase subunit II [Thermoplasmata archaeon]|nr:cytochrome c oxidase subunit II [Thermoplasmata archaeon]
MVNRLEVAWTLATVALITGVAVYSTVLLYQVDALPAHPAEYIDVIGHQWYWEFCYPANGSCYNTSYQAPALGAAQGSLGNFSGGALWAAPGTTIQINVTATDVIHSFNIPALGVRIDAIPGRTNYFAFNIPSVSPGTVYLIQCTEFCGTFHGTMRSDLVVT